MLVVEDEERFAAGLRDGLDEIEGIDTGADDYLTKPVSYAVLLAGPRALLRREARQRTVDLDRFALWARQLGIDASAGDEGAVAGDVTSLELVRERLKDDTTGGAVAATVTTDLDAARAAADRKDLAQAEELAPGLAEHLAQATR